MFIFMLSETAEKEGGRVATSGSSAVHRRDRHAPEPAYQIGPNAFNPPGKAGRYVKGATWATERRPGRQVFRGSGRLVFLLPLLTSEILAGYGRERAVDYIGCKIGLISNADIRHEGTLSAISEQDSTVSLENVRSYGTENRRPGAFIPPQDNVYEYIIFRGADIKDLVVYELPVVSALRSSVDSDPAVLEIAALAGQNGATNDGTSQGSGSQNMNGKPVSVQNLMNSQQGGQQRGGGQQRYFNGGNRGGNSNGSSIVYSSRGGNWNRGFNRGGYTGGQGYRQGFNANGMQNRSRFDIEEARKADFDVEAANEEFRKMEISKGDETDNSSSQTGAKAESGSQQTEAKPGYNPDQFFDNISCDAIEKEQQNKQREQMNNLGMNNQWQDLWQKERQHNAETFGLTSRTFNRGGRGGRLGFRGGYQNQSGGYQNQNGGGGWGNNGGNQSGGGGGWGRGGQRYNGGGGGGGGMGRGMGRQQNQGNDRGNGNRASNGNGNQNGGSNQQQQQQAKQITLYLQADGKTYAAAQPGNGGGAGRNGGGGGNNGGGGGNNGGNGGGARRSRSRRNRNRNGATGGKAAGGGQNQSVLLVASKA